MTTKTTPPARRNLPSLNGSEHRAIHASSLWRDTLEQTPGWVAAADALRRLDAIKLPAAADPGSDLRAAVVEAAVHGDDLTLEGIMAEATAAAVHHTATQLAADALNWARTELIGDLDAALDFRAMYRCLNTELGEVWARLRSMPQPTDLADAETAVARDRVQDLTAWRELLTRHTSIRNRQSQLDRVTGAGPGEYAVLRYFKHPDRAWPAYTAFVAGIPEQDRATGEQRPLRPPWEDAPVNTHDWVARAVELDLDVWVPTPDELAAEAARIRAAGIPAGEDNSLTHTGYRRERLSVHRAMPTD